MRDGLRNPILAIAFPHIAANAKRMVQHSRQVHAYHVRHASGGTVATAVNRLHADYRTEASLVDKTEYSRTTLHIFGVHGAHTFIHAPPPRIRVEILCV